MWKLQGTGTLLDGTDGILQGVYLLDVVGVIGVHQRADGDEHVACPHVFAAQCVRSRTVEDVGGVMVLVDDLQRHEAFARVGQCEVDRPGVKIEDR